MLVNVDVHSSKKLHRNGVCCQAAHEGQHVMDCRRVLVMDWVTGVKLTGLPPAEIRRLVATGQEAFLTQLLEVGFFHGDPHPGNLLKVTHRGGSYPMN